MPMATNKSASRVRPSPDSSKAAAGLLVSRVPVEAAEVCDEIHEVIEDERSRLMTAESLLHCIAIAMNEDDGEHSRGPDYQTLVTLARDLIKQSIDQLDSMRLQPSLWKLRMHERHEVKEDASAYVH
jgi:hypothetical protein